MITQIFKNRLHRLKLKQADSVFQAGFSLTEVLIALTVFTIGLLSLVLLFPHGMTAANQTTSLSIATLLAQQKMEDVKRDDTVWSAGTNKGPISFPLEPKFKWTVQVVAGGGSTRIVTVTVTWDINRSYELQTSI
ncbi:MAG: prepilin-type N-terminal cleavage/methylation domain-containing protein [bacterium]|nr:prepilin-type N-terminal cleavage/methylation domain-containing protein [bacterium]